MAKKVLIVDDDPAFLEFLGEALKREGFETLACSSGPAALRAAPGFRPDVVLLDLMMDGMHGFEVCAALRRDKTLGPTKIVILSAKNYDVDRKEAAAAGADLYLVKPFKLEDLVATIEAQ